MNRSDPSSSTAQFGRGATLLSLGFGAAGVFSFAYFSLASYALEGDEYKRIVLLWSITFVAVGVIYRPVEQLVARGIGVDRDSSDAHVRAAVLIQAAFAAVFVVVSLIFKDKIEGDVFEGSSTLFWILITTVVLFAVSFPARGWLAGHGRFGLYGLLVTAEAAVRMVFPALVLIGLDGQELAAFGVLSAPAVSLAIVGVALARRKRLREGVPIPQGVPGASLSEGTTFAASAFFVLLAEQALLNVAILVAETQSSDDELAGHVFNAFLIARAPLVLFMAVQASLLPHLAGLTEEAGRDAFQHAVRTTVAVCLGFAVAVALGLLAIGPPFMDAFFGGDFSYGRGGLALLGLGVGIHLASSTLTQAALARGQAVGAAVAWLVAALAFALFMVFGPFGDDDIMLRAEIGYLGAATLLLGLTWWFVSHGVEPVRERAETVSA